MADKIISDLELAPTLTGDMLLPVENGVGTFAASIDDVKDFVISEIPSASETEKGIIELANNAEVIAATDAEKAITSAALASIYGTSLLSTNSYTRKPIKVSGSFAEEITQYGNLTTTISGGGSQAVIFPMTFPNALRSIMLTINGAGGDNDALACPIIVARSTSGFTVKNTDADSTITSLYWEAKGN
jgi:hypothetical protein